MNKLKEKIMSSGWMTPEKEKIISQYYIGKRSLLSKVYLMHDLDRGSINYLSSMSRLQIRLLSIEKIT